MAQAVRSAIATGEHLAVQAGTGTGKSLAYLVPAIRHAVEHERHGRRLHGHHRAAAPARRPRPAPRSPKALKPLLGRAPDVRHPQGPPQLPVPQQAARRRRDDPERRAVRPVRRSPRWAARSSGSTSGPTTPRPATATSSCPGVPDATWRQVSVTARECLGAAKLPGRRRLLRRAGPRRGRAGRHRRHQPRAARHRRAWTGARCCPSTTWWSSTRRTSWSTGSPASPPAELTAGVVARGRAPAGQADRPGDRRPAGRGGRGPRRSCSRTCRPGRWDALPAGRGRARCRRSATRPAPAARRSGARAPARTPEARRRPQDRPGRAGRGARHRRPAARARSTSRTRRSGTTSSGWPRRARTAPAQVLHAAPLWVGGLLRERLFGALHGGAHLGHAGARRHLRRAGPAVGAAAAAADGRRRRRPGARSRTRPKWSGLDVGSPFAHASSGILYVAKQLPPPGPRRAAPGLPRRDRRAGRGGGRPHARAVLLDARGQAGHRGAARPARHAAALPGRRRHDAAGQAVRRGRGDLAVRHAVAVAGRRRARPVAAAA